MENCLTGRCRLLRRSRHPPRPCAAGWNSCAMILGRRPRMPQENSTMSKQTLLDFAAAVAAGRIRVVDLTQPLRPSTPVIQLPPNFAPSNPFAIEEISHYDDRG